MPPNPMRPGRASPQSAHAASGGGAPTVVRPFAPPGGPSVFPTGTPGFGFAPVPAPASAPATGRQPAPDGTGQHRVPGANDARQSGIPQGYTGPGEAPAVVFPGQFQVGNLAPGNKPLAVRAVTPMGALFPHVQSKFQQNICFSNRVLPQSAWFSPALTPERPLLVGVGAYAPPDSMEAYILDYSFDIYEYGPGGEALLVPKGSFSSSIGISLRNTGASALNGVQLALIPTTPPSVGDTYVTPGGRKQPSTAYTASVAAQTTTNITGAGSAIIPAGIGRVGPPGPFTIYVGSGDTLTAELTIARRLTRPLAFVEVRISGVLMSALQGDSVQPMLGIK